MVCRQIFGAGLLFFLADFRIYFHKDLCGAWNVSCFEKRKKINVIHFTRAANCNNLVFRLFSNIFGLNVIWLRLFGIYSSVCSFFGFLKFCSRSHLIFQKKLEAMKGGGGVTGRLPHPIYAIQVQKSRQCQWYRKYTWIFTITRN